MKLSDVLFTVETIFKVIFIVICPFNLPYTLLLAFITSVIGLLRVTKTPKMNKQYLARVLMNNHGQNILYISFGAIGFVNYLYYAPIVLFYAFSVCEFPRLFFPQWKINESLNVLRLNKWWIDEGKCRLEIFFFLYLLFSLPFDFMNRGLKCFVMAQFLFIKYRINDSLKSSCVLMNAWIEGKTSKIGIVNSAYKKLAGWIYSYANRDLSGQNQQQPQPNQG